MKSLNTYINEKYLIDKNTKLDVLPEDENQFNIVADNLAKWLFKKDTYKGVKNNRFEFLKKVDNNIVSLIDYFSGEFEILADECGFNGDANKLAKFIEKYNDELIEYSTNFYHDMYSKDFL